MLFWGILGIVAILFIPFAGILSTGQYFGSTGVGNRLSIPYFFFCHCAQATTPHQRAESIGTFRLWRDLGYAIGAIISGITADLFGVNYAIILIGLITIASSVIIEIRMPKDN
jgi:hypothetical protein